MHIAIGSDHAGFNLKQTVMSLLCEMGHGYKDFGCHDTGAVDYPDIGKPVAEAVSQGEFDCGILICSTGVGMSIVANKVSGIRAALCQDMFSARRAREHNNANILCLGEGVIGQGLARDIVTTYLTSEFIGGRHAHRVEKIQALDA
ncbi:ribose 5-phosphate isomerase B [Chloroflexota bacterium]